MPPLTNIEVDRKTPLADAETRLPSLHDFFSPGGILARSSLAFEHRPGQYAMAKAIEQAFADRRHLIIEAGTGTGKTLAYLLPALRRARKRSSASSSPPAQKICRSSSTSRTSPSSNPSSATPVRCASAT